MKPPYYQQSEYMRPSICTGVELARDGSTLLGHVRVNHKGYRLGSGAATGLHAANRCLGQLPGWLENIVADTLKTAAIETGLPERRTSMHNVGDVAHSLRYKAVKYASDPRRKWKVYSVVPDTDTDKTEIRADDKSSVAVFGHCNPASSDMSSVGPPTCYVDSKPSYDGEAITQIPVWAKSDATGMSVTFPILRFKNNQGGTGEEVSVEEQVQQSNDGQWRKDFYAEGVPTSFNEGDICVVRG